MKTIIVAAFFAAALSAQVVTGPPQNVGGTASAQFGANFGNATVGGSAIGNVNATFGANGNVSASGLANAAGKGGGMQTVTPSSFISGAHSGVVSGAAAKGDLNGGIAANGTAAQNNWGLVGPDNNNFAAGSNTSSGGFQGQKSGTVITGGGIGAAVGSTTGATHSAANSADSNVQTYAVSSGALSPGMAGSALVSGNGVVGAGSMVQHPNGSYAGGSIQGNASYQGQCPTGFLTAGGTTAGTIGADTVTASAGVTAGAKIGH